MTDTQEKQINNNIQTNIKQVIPFSYESIKISSEKRHVSQEQLQHDYDYFMAQQILESILKNDLISMEEFNKITALNRQSFSPTLAQIMPENR